MTRPGGVSSRGVRFRVPPGHDRVGSRSSAPDASFILAPRSGFFRCGSLGRCGLAALQPYSDAARIEISCPENDAGGGNFPRRHTIGVTQPVPPGQKSSALGSSATLTCAKARSSTPDESSVTWVVVANNHILGVARFLAQNLAFLRVGDVIGGAVFAPGRSQTRPRRWRKTAKNWPPARVENAPPPISGRRRSLRPTPACAWRPRRAGSR